MNDVVPDGTGGHAGGQGVEEVFYLCPVLKQYSQGYRLRGSQEATTGP